MRVTTSRFFFHLSAALLALAPLGTARGHLSDDPWLMIEEGWVWNVVRDRETLAGTWNLDDGVLHAGVSYQMTLNVTETEGVIGVFLGDNPMVRITGPGAYRFPFTANDRERMVFKAVDLAAGRAKLVANTIRVEVLSTDASYQPEPPPDSWLAIEEGWIWQVVDGTQRLAGRSGLTEEELPGGYDYEMTFDVTDVAGEIGLTLGDREQVVFDTPGVYGYRFTANQHKRMLFEAVSLESGRAKLAANSIRVTAEPSTGDGSKPLRIAYSSDGNQHDADDWSASPLALAMLADESSGFELVHFDYNNHLGDNNAWMAGSHRDIVEEAVSRYGFDGSIFFDDQRRLSDAVRHIAQAINASGEEDRLYLVCAGPMEVCWRGIDAAMDGHERFVTVISHSGWNDNHADTVELSHTMDDIVRDFAVQVRHIDSQNDTAFRSPVEDWVWLQQHGANGQWLYERITAGSRPAHPGDASDAGMVYYVLDGMTESSDNATMFDIRALFND